MKRLVTLLLMLGVLLTGASTWAQVNIGAQLGLNMANISMDGGQIVEGDFGTRMGLNVGAVAEMKLGPVTLQSGLLFNQVGTKYEESINQAGYSTEEEVTVKASYLTIPILAKYIMPMERFTLYGLAGPALSFFMGGTAEGGITGDFAMDIDEEINDFVKSMDTALVLGVGVMKEMNGRTFFVDIRYSMGLCNAVDADPDSMEWGFISKLEAKNQIITINVGVLGLLSL